MRVIADTFIGSSGFNGLVNYTSAILIELDRDPDVEVVAVVPSGRALPMHDVLRRSGVHVEVLPAVEGDPLGAARQWYDEVLPAHLAQTTSDLYFGPVFFRPLDCPVPSVTMVHDVMWQRLPDSYSSGVRRYLETFGRRSAEASTRVLVPSGQTSSDVMTAWDVQSPPVITPLAPVLDRYPSDRVAARSAVRTFVPEDGRLVVNVGGTHPRKRLDVLIKAVALLARQRVPDIRLLIVNADREHVHEWIRRAGVADRVSVTARIDESVIPDCFAAGDVFCYPSEYEGFGLDPLEAAACGTPVVTTATSPQQEILGDAAEYVDPTDPERVADALERVFRDPVRSSVMRESGLVAAARYNWMTTAGLTKSVFDDVLLGRVPLAS